MLWIKLQTSDPHLLSVDILSSEVVQLKIMSVYFICSKEALILASYYYFNYSARLSVCLIFFFELQEEMPYFQHSQRFLLGFSKAGENDGKQFEHFFNFYF